MRFKDWLKLSELNVGGTASPKLTPNQAVATNAMTTALKKMPMKPGQKLADVVNDPKQQPKILAKTNQVAQNNGDPLNIGTAADLMDPKNPLNPANPMNNRGG